MDEPPAGQDDIGLLMDIEAPPQRVRVRAARTSADSGSLSTTPSDPKGILL